MSEAGVRFEEAISYLKAKLPEASMAWDDLSGPVHAKVFTIAGATTTDLARDMHQSLVKALEQGQTLSAFRKDFDNIVRTHGWSYNGARGWRTALIFDTNMRSASMAGRWSQLQANKGRRPYLGYRTAGDARVRPLHQSWNGIVRHIDDPFWRTHYPPNGWGCRCTVRSYADWEIKDLGMTVETKPYKVQFRDVTNKDGERTDRVPVGIDPGWDHNVGQAWIAPELALGGKLATLPRSLRGAVVDKTITPAFQKAISENWKAFQATVKSTGKPQGAPQILGFLDSATLNGLAKQVPELELQSSAIAALDTRTKHLSGAHKAEAAPLQVWPQSMIDELPELLRNYRAVLWDEVSNVLVFVPQASLPGAAAERVPKIVMRPNTKTKVGQALSLVSLGSADQTNMTAKRYRVLIGKLK